MEDCRFGNIYYSTNDTSLSKRQSDRPGWFSTSEGKKDLLSNYRELLMTGGIINPSDKALTQASEFVYLPNGRIEHGGSVLTIDPSDKGDNHGDVVIADALCAKIFRERKQSKPEMQAGPPVMSFEWRRKDRSSQTEEWS